MENLEEKCVEAGLKMTGQRQGHGARALSIEGLAVQASPSLNIARLSHAK